MLKWPAGDGSGTKQGSAEGTGVGESAAGLPDGGGGRHAQGRGGRGNLCLRPGHLAAGLSVHGQEKDESSVS